MRYQARKLSEQDNTFHWLKFKSVFTESGSTLSKELQTEKAQL